MNHVRCVSVPVYHSDTGVWLSDRYPRVLSGRWPGGVSSRVTGGCCTRATAQRAPPRLQISINRPIVEPLSPAPAAQDGKMLRGSRKRLVADKLAYGKEPKDARRPAPRASNTCLAMSCPVLTCRPPIVLTPQPPPHSTTRSVRRECAIRAEWLLACPVRRCRRTPSRTRSRP